LSSIRNCGAAFLLVASLVAGEASAQSTRHLSLVGSWRVSDVYPFGQEFQLRYGSEKWSVGGGYMDSWRLGLFNNSASQESNGFFVEPRYALSTRGEPFGPFLFGRLGLMRQEVSVTPGGKGKQDTVLGIGAGIAPRLASWLSFDLGVAALKWSGEHNTLGYMARIGLGVHLGL
jgi:hypothetical protein